MSKWGIRTLGAPAAVVLVVLSCGGQTVGDARDGGAKLTCPQSIPNGPCSPEGLVCQYGENPRCLWTETCKQGGWSLFRQPVCLGPDPSCPATREAAAGQTCAKMNAYCNYSGLTCDCTNCTKYPIEHCMGPLLWVCDAPNTTVGCPPARPNIGVACASEGLLCDYGCEAGVSRQCTNGMWVSATGPYGCPASTREVKDHIDYLDPSERAHIADQARALRLATWRYKDPALAEREHLGYILEDAPMSPSSDMQKKQVDLYAYTSMVLALAQQQDEEIKELRARLAELEKRTPKPPVKGR